MESFWKITLGIFIILPIRVKKYVNGKSQDRSCHELVERVSELFIDAIKENCCCQNVVCVPEYKEKWGLLDPNLEVNAAEKLRKNFNRREGKRRLRETF